MKTPIRVAIVEDHAGYRETLGQIFGNTSDFKVVASCPNGESALIQIPKAKCNLVLMDINLPGQSGIDCLRVLKAQIPRLHVVMLTSYDDNDRLFQSLMAGADGYLLKRVVSSRLLEALRDIVAGGAPISPQIARRMVEYFHKMNAPGFPPSSQNVPVDSAVDELTAREREVLELLAAGATPKEVAAKLNISWQTVRNHIRFVYEKLHVHTRTDAVLKYLGRDTFSRE
ncbi:MAG TPA: response regulator transcription factor [Verrucomicrobiae bacterium]|jgi:DNA-binding NarL/FixJ family response regulator|nr:response regulator transcription factor [Verrucomicrobiae bacterium]